MDRPPAELRRLIFLLCSFLTLLQIDNPGVGLIGDFGQNQQVVEPEALRRLPLTLRIAVDPGESDAIARLACNVVLQRRSAKSLP